MKNEIIQFDGMFQWWLYSVSHGQLLLRRTKSPQLPTRVDILFKNVAFVHIVHILTNPTVFRITPDELDLFTTGEFSLGDREAFLIRAQNFNGCIVAGTIAWHEDDKDYDAPSALMP